MIQGVGQRHDPSCPQVIEEKEEKLTLT